MGKGDARSLRETAHGIKRSPTHKAAGETACLAG